MKKFFNEFKEFIARGNVVDMAVGVVIGGAFKSIVDSLVADIIMPAIGMITGKVDISKLAFTIDNPADPAKPLVSLTYGNFLQQILNFLIIAFTIFCVIKAMNVIHEKLAKKEEAIEEATEEAAGPTTEELLTEIRDLLKKD